MIELTQEQYNQKIEILKEKIEQLLKDHNMTIVPQLHVTQSGIIPILTFVNVDANTVVDGGSGPINA